MAATHGIYKDLTKPSVVKNKKKKTPVSFVFRGSEIKTKHSDRNAAAVGLNWGNNKNRKSLETLGQRLK